MLFRVNRISLELTEMVLSACVTERLTFLIACVIFTALCACESVCVCGPTTEKYELGDGGRV